MSTVTKENEILTSIPETTTPRLAGTTLPPAGDTPARPQPVALEVAVTVNGARTVAGSDKREPFSEATKTVLIFGHGAVVRLSSSVAPGQLLFLTNEKTKKEVVCQVVKSKNYHNVSGYVELEFTEPVAGFWGMRFPSSGPSQVSHQSSPASPVASATPSKTSSGGSAIESRPPAGSASGHSETKSPAPGLPRVSLPSQPVASVSTSLPVTSPKQNLPPASPSVTHTQAPLVSRVSGDKLSNVVEISKSKPAPVETSSTATKTSPPHAKSILDSDEVKIPSWLEPLTRNSAASSAALPEIAAKEQPKHHSDILEVQDVATETAPVTEPAADNSVAVPSFSGQLLVDDEAFPGREAWRASHENPAAQSGSNKKVLLGAIAAGVLLLVSAGAWYMQQTASSGPGNAASAVNTPSDTGNSAQTPSPPAASTATPGSPSGTYTAVSQPAPAGGGASSGLTATNSAEVANANKKIATVDSAAVAAPPQPKKPMLGAVNLSGPTLNRPNAGEDRAEEALNLGESSGPGEGLASGLSVSNSRQPVAPPAPLPVGGDVKAARLLSSVAPTYPSLAKAQRIGGNVKIDALVDATGHITSMAIVSGPPLLQQAAMDALRHWKYEPAQLDGKPVPMHLAVTVQFKLQ